VPIAPQILLPLENMRSDRLEDFVAGPNKNVVTAIRELAASGEGGLFIRGPEGSGKTHLLNAACTLAQERGLQAFYMALKSVPATASGGLEGLEDAPLVCIDDIDHVAGQPEWEDSLFHLFNRMRERRHALIVTSSASLSSLEFSLPDLGSRLAWGLRLQLEPLDDRAKFAVLQLKAAALGIDLPDEVAYYLLSRGSRNMNTLLGNFEAVRVAALAGKRRLTVPLAREVLSATIY